MQLHWRHWTPTARRSQRSLSLDARQSKLAAPSTVFIRICCHLPPARSRLPNLRRWHDDCVLLLFCSTTACRQLTSSRPTPPTSAQKVLVHLVNYCNQCASTIQNLAFGCDSYALQKLLNRNFFYNFEWQKAPGKEWNLLGVHHNCSHRMYAICRRSCVLIYTINW